MTDIAELFSRDPLELTQDDITKLVTRLRESRGQFSLGNMKAGKAPAAPKSAAGKAALGLNLDLSSLGIKK